MRYAKNNNCRSAEICLLLRENGNVFVAKGHRHHKVASRYREGGAVTISGRGGGRRRSEEEAGWGIEI